MPRTTDVEERREQILRAAVKVFDERGYTNATISDIASAAGVAHGTVYLYFRSKAEILQHLHARFAQWLLDELDAPTGLRHANGNLAAELYWLFRMLLDVCYQHRQVTEVCLKELDVVESEIAPGLRAMEETLTDRLTKRFAQAIASGEMRPLRPESASDLVVRLLGVTIRRLLAVGTEADVEQLARDTVDLILFGLASENLRNN